jgi:hypothetical protein
LPAADPARQHLVQRANCDSEDQGPDHQRQERRKDLVAERREREDQAGADQHVEQHRRFLLLGCAIKGQGRIHIASPSARARTELVLSRENRALLDGRHIDRQAAVCGRNPMDPHV